MEPLLKIPIHLSMSAKKSNVQTWYTVIFRTRQSCLLVSSVCTRSWMFKRILYNHGFVVSLQVFCLFDCERQNADHPHQSYRYNTSQQRQVFGRIWKGRLLYRPIISCHMEFIWVFFNFFFIYYHRSCFSLKTFSISSCTYSWNHKFTYTI